MTIPLNVNRDGGGNTIYAPLPSDIIYTATLTSGGGETHINLPASAQKWIVVFSYQPGANVWVRFGGTAAVPAGATLASASSELNPAQRFVSALKNDGTANTLSMITADTSANVFVGFYAA